MRARSWTAYVYLGPAAAFMAAFIAYPMLRSFYLSFTKYNYVYDPRPTWAGLGTYAAVLQDSVFQTALQNQFKFGIPFFVIAFVLSLLVAATLMRVARGRTTLQLAVILPMIIPPSLGAIVFLWLLEPGFGVVNAAWRALLHTRPPAWFLSPELALYVMVPIFVWEELAFPVIIFLAGLQTISASLYDAARVDGASFWGEIRFVTLPSLRPTMVVASVYLITQSLKMFDLPYVLTQGGPANATFTLYYYAWTRAFKFYEMGNGAAAAYITAVLILLFSAGSSILLGERPGEAL
ncbi:MAG TPA: sugar ABC transporter permease [bacterium]|nr:sugar ABC transporter permease [bacterium]